nr:ribonuclease H-like domain-containing protein [Tanacetum cinerariifolium]
MRPCGCLVIDLNTLDHLGKFDEKADEGFFIGYSVNSKAFRVFNSRTRIVEETLHITFLENKYNVAGSGPTWLFDIDTLTKSMNYKPVVAGNQSNDSAGKARDSPGDGFKPSGKEEKKNAEDQGNEDNEVLSIKEPRVNQEKDANVNITNNINTVNLTANAASIKDNAVDENIVYGSADDPNMPNLKEIVYSDDDEDVGAEADMTNLDTNITLELQEKGVIDSGCSKHMTENMSYLSEYKEIDGGYVAFGGDLKGDNLGKFDEKADEGFFIGYSVNSKAFRVFNSRTTIIEETLHITFLENKSNVAGSGPTWLFDIDTLTKSMNYKPTVTGNQSNDSAEEEEKMNDEDQGNEDNEVLNIKEPRVNQEKEANVNNTNNINTVNLTANAASTKDNVVDENIVYGCADDPNMPNLKEIVYSDDDEDVGAEADMTNLDTNITATTLLHGGGRTTHSRFAIPINIVKDLPCTITANSDLVELIRERKLIIKDKAPRVHTYSFEVILGTLRDITTCTYTTSSDTVVGGDFLRRLRVIPMALRGGRNDGDAEQIKDFAWNIGDGKIGGKDDGEFKVEFHEEMFFIDYNDHVEVVIQETFENRKQKMWDPTYFQDRAILAPTTKRLTK